MGKVARVILVSVGDDVNKEVVRQENSKRN